VRTILLVLIYAVLTLFLLILLIVFFPFGLREPILAVGKWAMGLGLKVLGIRVEVSGREAIDRRTSYIFMANHLSFIDGPMLVRLIPQSVRVILKKSIFRIPVVGQGMKFVGFVPVDRKGIRGGKIAIEVAARLMREKGYSYLIFPEGTRSLDGRIHDFRRGGFFLALESGAPIAPISITGTFELMPKGSLFAKSGRVRVRFHPPVPTAGYEPANMGDLMDRVRAVIASGLAGDGNPHAAPQGTSPGGDIKQR
jgi:1-acyl-sn-glycerol-3-phosphate acyltransferase